MCIKASDGESAIKLARSPTGCCANGCQHARHDGIQATGIIHQEMPEIKIIGLSMFQEGAQAAVICEAGAIDYLTKSGSADALLDAANAVRKTSDNLILLVNRSGLSWYSGMLLTQISTNYQKSVFHT